MNIADKWVCAGWFKPEDYVLRVVGERPMYFPNPEHAACGAWSNGLTYLIFAAIVASVSIVVFAAVFVRVFSKEPGFSEPVIWTTITAVAVGTLWPLSTFVVPIVALAFGGVRLGAVLATHATLRDGRRKIEMAEQAKRIKELAPYIEQLEKEMAQ